MPPKKNRISTSLFKTLRGGKRLTTPYFDITYFKGDSYKVAVVVKKNIFNNAVKRNKTRRKTYTLFTSLYKNHKGYFIAYPKRTILTTPFSTLSATLQALTLE
jgi:ribonuclease P protein component